MRINFASTRLAFILISLLILHILFSAIIPQEDISQDQIINLEESLGDYYIIIDKLGLDRIYTAPPFFVLLGLLALNLTFGNIKRFLTVYKVEKNLLKARHLGSIIFHLSLVLIMVGIILNFLYKSEGVFSLTEGQLVLDQEDNYHKIYKGPLHEAELNRFNLKLEKIDESYQVQDAQTSAAQISILPRGYSNPIEKFVYTNHPFRWQDLEFHYGLFTGYSPKIEIKDKDDNPIFSAYIRLAIQKSKGKTIHADYVLIPTLNARVNLKIEDIESSDLDNIILNISVENEQKQLYLGDLGLKETVKFDDYTLSFTGLRRWCYISVVDSPFLNLVFFGFWSALIGMLIGFLPRVWEIKNNE